MKKSLIVSLVLLAAACRHTTTEETVGPPPRPIVGAGATPRAALDEFLASVKTQDLQAMSLAWGDKNGPAQESKSMSRTDMEQREVYLMRCFRYDSYRVLGDQPAAEGERQLQVEITRGTVRRTTEFFMARGPSRWYVRTAGMEPVRELCSAK